jgi:hypothetical protein
MKFIPAAIVALVLILLPTDITLAQGPLVTCGGAGQPTCGSCEFVALINTVIVWLIGILFMVFAVMMVIAGFGLITSGGNQSALDAAKSKFTNAIVGIIIVLAAWLIVDTVMQGLVGGGSTGQPMGELSGWGPWSRVMCTSETTPTAYVREGPGATDPSQPIVTPPGTTVPAGSLSQAEAEALLAGQNITVVSSGNCTDRTRTNCTSLDGVRVNTLNRIIELQNSVGAPLVITGGTEAGHAGGQYSHANGYKIDLRTTPALNNYIETNYTSLGGNRWRDPNGNIYYRHGPVDHWDVTVTN